MATSPFEELLSRDMAKESARPIIEKASPLLQEVVNHATMVFQRCQVSIGRSDDSDEKDVGQNLAPILLYQHIIEMTDGIEVLIANGCSGPAVPLLRSNLEALLFLEFMLKEDYKRRSLSWLCSYVHKRIETYELRDPSTQRRKGLKTTLEREGGIEAPDFDPSQKAANLKAILNKELPTIEAEYQRQKHKSPNWYSLFNGPHDLCELAIHLDRAELYNLLYRKWSSTMHATDATRYLATIKGNPFFCQLRHPGPLTNYAWYAATFMVEATRLMIRAFSPGEDLSRWEKEEVEKRLYYLKNVQVKLELDPESM